MIDRAKFEQAIRNKIIEANAKFGTSIILGYVEWYTKGQTFAFAKYNAETGVCAIGMSEEACEKYEHETLTDTIPHEVAHVVHAAKGHTDRTHGAVWRRYCITLGGTGKRTSKSKLSRARRAVQYRYQTDSGYLIWVGAKTHNKMQTLGCTRIVKATGERFRAANYTKRKRILS